MKDGIARTVGFFEALLAFGLVLGLKWSGLAYPSLIALWFIMAGAVFVHFKASKVRDRFSGLLSY